MPKLLAIVSTLTTLAVLATTGMASAGKIVHDHRHGATPPAANSPPPAAPKGQAVPRVAARKVWEKKGAAEATKAYEAGKQAKANLASRPPNSAPTGGKPTQQK